MDGSRGDWVPPVQGDASPDRIDGDWWLTREIARPAPLLGEAICSTTRMLLGGPTGAGKTHLALAIAGAIATTASCFLHWTVPADARSILYIDGEMARDLIQDRMRDLHRRLDRTTLANFHMLCREDFPTMEGLNTPAGQEFVKAKIEQTNPALVVLDNRMCLLLGDMKDEVPWTDTMPLVREITRTGRAQLWLDHTGHNVEHIYGSKTKEWQMDAVGILEEQTLKGADINVRLKFTKARRRRPETRADFAPVIITLREDQWTAVPDEDCGKTAAKVSPSRQPFYDALVGAIGKSECGPGRTTIGTWQLECIRRGLIEKPGDRENYRQRDARHRMWRVAKGELIAAKWIAVDGDFVTDLKNRWG